jgi:hypothetical protein
MVVTMSLLLIATCVNSQVLKVKVKVNSTVGMEEVQSYNNMAPKAFQSGTEHEKTGGTIPFEAMNAIKIKGKANLELLVRYEAPDFLVNTDKQSMPLNLEFGWQNSENTKLSGINWMKSSSNVIRLGNELNPYTKQQSDDLQAYLYFKTTGTIPSNAEMPFEGNVKLIVEY